MARKVLGAIGSILALMGALGMFLGETWDRWRVILKAITALPMTQADAAVYRQLTGRSTLPTVAFREVWLVIGRRGGKSIVTALMLVYAALCRTYALAAGEVGVIACFAADRRQARVVKNYVSAMLGILGQLVDDPIETENSDAIKLRNGIVIEIVTANFRTLRGRTILAAVLDEIAYWPTDDSLNPDTEILNAIRPAMATVENALLVAISSPYARRGELWKAYQRHFGRDDSPVLVVCADSKTMNPALPQTIIDRAFEDDPAHALAEYGRDGRVEFRTDVETFVTIEVVDQCTENGRLELPYDPKFTYGSFTDAASGTSDSFVTAIGHLEGDQVVVDVVRERVPPFDPDSVIEEHALLLRTYGVTTVSGDKWAGQWPALKFQKCGISYRVSDYAKSDLYKMLLPRLNAATITLLDIPKLAKQLVALERKTAWGGRESIDHPPNGHDDVANAVAGVSSLFAKPARIQIGTARLPAWM